MARRLRDVILATLIGCAVAGLPAFAQPQAAFKVDWANDRLSVRASDASLSDVIEEVARVTGMQVVGKEKLSGRVSTDFAGLPREQALETLLAGVNYMIQKAPAEPGGSPGLVLLVHSMASAAPATELSNSPMTVPALDAVIANEAIAEAEDRIEAEDDPDTSDDERDRKDEARQLVADGAFAPTVSVSALIDYMEDPNVEVRVEALHALSRRSMKEALKPIVDALGDDSPAVSRTAIEILGRARDGASLNAVGALLQKHPDTALRIAALRVFALRSDPASVVYLRNALKDPSPVVNTAAAQMIAEFERRAREAR